MADNYNDKDQATLVWEDTKRRATFEVDDFIKGMRSRVLDIALKNANADHKANKSKGIIQRVLVTPEQRAAKLRIVQVYARARVENGICKGCGQPSAGSGDVTYCSDCKQQSSLDYFASQALAAKIKMNGPTTRR